MGVCLCIWVSRLTSGLRLDLSFCLSDLISGRVVSRLELLITMRCEGSGFPVRLVRVHTRKMQNSRRGIESLVPECPDSTSDKGLVNCSERSWYVPPCTMAQLPPWSSYTFSRKSVLSGICMTGPRVFQRSFENILPPLDFFLLGIAVRSPGRCYGFFQKHSTAVP